LSRSERAEIAVRMSQAIEGGLLQIGAEARMLGKKLLELRRRLFADSLRLVFKLSTQRGELLDFSTAILRGAVGLDTAIDRFDPDRGYQFSTYATWWIHHYIQRSRHDFSRAIRMPVHVAESTNRFWKAQQTIWAQTGERPPMDWVLDGIDAKLPPAEKLAEYRRLTSVARLDGHAPFGLAEVVLDPDVPTPMEGSPSAQWVLRAFRCLDELVERLHSRKPGKNDTQRVEIFRARLGLGLPRRTSLQEIGERMDLSRERIRQLETQVLEKVRARLFRTAAFIPPWRWIPADD
jgi:RNA polymerase primary sigma factor